MAKYRRCYASYEWQVICDCVVKCHERNKELALIVLDHHLREKKYDNVYLVKTTKIRYFLEDDD